MQTALISAFSIAKVDHDMNHKYMMKSFMKPKVDLMTTSLIYHTYLIFFYGNFWSHLASSSKYREARDMAT